uniref:CSON003065 protein n=1 Tax=Culicoides sonorensis TaxID=179676 RepID=A0A336L277_CULSO
MGQTQCFTMELLETSLQYQFFRHEFPKRHVPTTKRTVYRSCLVCDTCIRELIVLDVAPQKRFPVDSLAEWNNGNPLGLRNVNAYVLVFDMGNLETFQIVPIEGTFFHYCRNMREQILDSFTHRDFEIMVVGNKYDLVAETNIHSQYCRNMREQILDSFTHRDFEIMVVGNKYDLVAETNIHSQELKDISTLVRKHWRCGYVECSTKYNFRISDIFRELLGQSGTGYAPKMEYSNHSRHKRKPENDVDTK